MRIRFLGGVLAAILLAVPTVFAQSPRGTAEAMVGGAKVSIEYGRPSLQGRDMLGQVTAGMVWRLGADASGHLTGLRPQSKKSVVPQRRNPWRWREHGRSPRTGERRHAPDRTFSFRFHGQQDRIQQI